MRLLLAIIVCAGTIAASPRVVIKLDRSTGSTPRDGRLILIVSKDMNGEPRSQVTWGVKTQQIFGKDLDRWKPGDTVEITADTPGDPMPTLAGLPAGTYNLQAVLNVYETFHRADGHVLKLHPDHGEGQQWNKSPGNLYSKPQHIKIDSTSVIEVNLTETIPAIDPPENTKRKTLSMSATCACRASCSASSGARLCSWKPPFLCRATLSPATRPTRLRSCKPTSVGIFFLPRNSA